eukprot:CAMPEP_0197442226 /NCGR_PEP_ID=MMETSP1175-20131217/8293_1 /TAXON_ID=1003142 /ORGANISM="Triceratium dubium, Strain CCMP147" /LENGTH=69 /DNA_ID=CAMNT_0042972655 /DNA_START=155 /DNA_END=361 /DNA_ORIENTATION=+
MVEKRRRNSATAPNRHAPSFSPAASLGHQVQNHSAPDVQLRQRRAVLEETRPWTRPRPPQLHLVQRHVP